jgi:hypothetical protein
MLGHSPRVSSAPLPLKRAVLARTLQHPLTLYPTAVGLLGVLGVALFGPTAVAIGAAAGGISLGLGHFATQYLFRADRVAAAHLKELHERFEQKKAQILGELEAKLEKLTALKTDEGYADQAIKQLRMVQKRFGTMQRLLGDKFEPTELTYGRYFLAGEQAYLSVLDNLDSIAARLESVSTIDLGYHEERLRALGKLKTLAAADEEEIRTIRERSALRAEQLDKINTLLTFNENAITEFDRVNTAIAEVKGSRSQSSVDLETAIRELEMLAGRAQKLSV